MLDARGEVLPLGGIEVGGAGPTRFQWEPEFARTQPFFRQMKTCGSEQRAGVASTVFPHLRRVGEPAMHRQTGAVRVDPIAKPTPRGQQDLVRNLDRLLVDGEKAP